MLNKKILSCLLFAFLFFILLPVKLNAITVTVNNTNDAGAGSLREAIVITNTTVGNDLINFNLGAGGPFTITLLSALPTLTDNAGVTIDGWDNAGNPGTPNTVALFNLTPGTPLNPIYKVVLGNGNNLTVGINISSSNNRIKGLVLQDFGDGVASANDIAINIAGNTNTIVGCYIGMDATGLIKGTRTAIGIQIAGNNNIIGDGTVAGVNLISGLNGGLYGVYMTGATTTSNTVKGCLIGMLNDGSTIVTGANQVRGVYIFNNSAYNIIGGLNAGDGNVISGNNNTGIYLQTTVGSNTVIGNRIGLKASLTTSIVSSPQQIGVMIISSANNVIGGPTVSHRNIISHNSGNGIAIQNAGANNNIVRGNYIGLCADGITKIIGAGQSTGVFLWNGCASNTIGGVNAGEGNVMSGNSFQGQNSNSNVGPGNIFLGNIVGPQANGVSVVAGNNQILGFNLNSAGTLIGNGTVGGRNIISANTSIGIYHALITVTGTIIKGNYIGPGSNGLAIPGANQPTGVQLQQESNNNFVGGYLGAFGMNPEGNLIAFNTSVGVNITSTLAVQNLVSRNNIYSNGVGLPIRLNYGVNQGNAGKPAPTAITFSPNIVIGSGAATAGVGDTVEVFKNTTVNCRDMRTYLGSTVALASGNWTLTGITINPGESVLATARTVANNNTSEAGACLLALPVELLSFDAFCDYKKVKLTWATGSELNSDYFRIEKTSDGVTHRLVGTVNAAGRSNTRIDYSIVDEQPDAGTTVYKLIQKDLDGTEKPYYTFYTYDCNIEKMDPVFYPSPTENEINITFPGLNKEVAFSYSIVDMLGHVVKESEVNYMHGNFKIDIRQFPAGIYAIKMISDQGTFSSKIIKN